MYEIQSELENKKPALFKFEYTWKEPNAEMQLQSAPHFTSLSHKLQNFCIDLSMKDVDKGRIVVREQPLLCLQTIDSQKSSLCCANCLIYIGDSDIQVSRTVI